MRREGRIRRQSGPFGANLNSDGMEKRGPAESAGPRLFRGRLLIPGGQESQVFRKEGEKADKISASSAERPWESARQTAALRRTKASPDG